MGAWQRGMKGEQSARAAGGCRAAPWHVQCSHGGAEPNHAERTCRRRSCVHSASHTKRTAAALLGCSASAARTALAMAGASRRLRVML